MDGFYAYERMNRLGDDYLISDLEQVVMMPLSWLPHTCILVQASIITDFIERFPGVMQTSFTAPKLKAAFAHTGKVNPKTEKPDIQVGRWLSVRQSIQPSTSQFIHPSSTNQIAPFLSLQSGNTIHHPSHPYKQINAHRSQTGMYVCKHRIDNQLMNEGTRECMYVCWLSILCFLHTYRYIQTKEQT